LKIIQKIWVFVFVILFSVCVQSAYATTLDPRIEIDTPYWGQIVEDNVLEIRGWALNGSGVSDVNVYVDGILKGKAETGISRPDVNQAFAGYPGGGQSGFKIALETQGLKRGNNLIVVEAVGVDGTKKELLISTFISKYPSINVVENPINNTFISGEVTRVSGWALNASGVKQIKIKTNGVYIGDAITGIQRTDVYSFSDYSKYHDSMNSGFIYELDNKLLTVGENSIVVEVIGNDGSIETTIIKIESSGFVYTTKKYDYSINQMIEKQNSISAKPVTDRYKDKPAYILTDNIVEVHSIAVNTGSNIRTSPDVSTNNIHLFTKELVPVNFIEIVQGESVNGNSSWYKFELNNVVLYAHNSVVKTYNATLDNPVLAVKRDTIVYDQQSIEGRNWFVLKSGAQINRTTNHYNGWSSISLVWRSPSNEDLYSELETKSLNNTELNENHIKHMNLTSKIDISEDALNNYLVGKYQLKGQAASFIEASKQYNVSLPYLVAHMILETGHGRSQLANPYGDLLVNGVPVYNFYGISAYDGSAYYSGSQYAYNQGWTTPEKAILGGAKWISENYINNQSYKQNTLYKMRWNPDKPGSHQYSTDIEMPDKIARIIYRDLLPISSNYKITIDVPIFSE